MEETEIIAGADTLYRAVERCLLCDAQPSHCLNELYGALAFRQYPFTMLHRLKQTEQSPRHHPEGNVWSHTLLVVDEAAKVKGESKNSKAFMWAALLHDIGKAVTTKNRNGKITAYDHDKAGARLAREFLLQLTDDGVLIDEICGLVRYHMQILFVVNKLKFMDVEGMKRETDVHEIALLGLCDRLGRLGSDPQEEKEQIKKFLKACDSDLPI